MVTTYNNVNVVKKSFSILIMPTKANLKRNGNFKEAYNQSSSFITLSLRQVLIWPYYRAARQPMLL